MLKRKHLISWLLSGIFLLVGCAAPAIPTTPTLTEAVNLTVSLLYPTGDSQIEMGQTIKVILQVTDGQERVVDDANVTVTFSDPGDQEIGSVPAVFGDGGVYRSEAWTVPHHTQEGLWVIKAKATASEGQGQSSGQVTVQYSTSEILYHKYGFWLDAPTLHSIQPSLTAERGDAENGLIRWGGIIPTQHVFTENWIEVHWLKGSFALDSPEVCACVLAR